MAQIKTTLKFAKEQIDNIVFLGRNATQLPNGTVEIDQHEFIETINRHSLSKTRITQSRAPLDGGKDRMPVICGPVRMASKSINATAGICSL